VAVLIGKSQQPMVLERNAAATTYTTSPINHIRPSQSIDQMAPPVRGSRHPITAYYTQFIDIERIKG